MIICKKMKVTISVLIFTTFFFIFNVPLYSTGIFLTSIGYSPGITDYYRLDPDPHTHTYKYVGLGFDFFGSYLNDVKKIGLGLDVHWGIISKMKIENNAASTVLDDWLGVIHQLNITPYFAYAPLLTDRMILLLGVGLSTTMNLYASEYGSDTNEYYWGISLLIHYKYFINERLFFNVGLRYTVDFIGYWDSEAITSMFQSQYYPVFGLGLLF